jgi:hypothetical protein
MQHLEAAIRVLTNTVPILANNCRCCGLLTFSSYTRSHLSVLNNVRLHSNNVQEKSSGHRLVDAL